MELAFDLCTLALYDVAIYADDSTSMKYAEGALNSSLVCCFMCVDHIRQCPRVEHIVDKVLSALPSTQQTGAVSNAIQHLECTGVSTAENKTVERGCVGYAC